MYIFVRYSITKQELRPAQKFKNMKKVLALFMAHKPTPEQLEGWDDVLLMKEIEDFDFTNISPLCTSKNLEEVAEALLDTPIMMGATHVAFMGEPCLTHHMAIASKKEGLVFVQATTERNSKDVTQEDGSVKKVSVFRHVMWREW